MNKLQVTAEQATAIQARLGVQSAEQLINLHATPPAWGSTDAQPLNDLTVAQLAQALYVGYEIEKPKFQTGDWVIRIAKLSADSDNSFNGKMAFQIVRESKYAMIDVRGCNHAMENIRHATPVEKFWAELNRPNNFFELGDVLVTENGDTYVIVADSENLKLRTCYLSDAIKMLDSDVISAIYPSESRKEVPYNASC